jgi:hypothetical protein
MNINAEDTVRSRIASTASRLSEGILSETTSCTEKSSH